MMPFKNEPFTDFSHPENQGAFRAALSQVRGQFGQAYPLVIGGERIYKEQKFASCNPANPAEVIGYQSEADLSDAERAIQAALVAFESWGRTPAVIRARYLLKAAAIMRRRKHELSATMVLEAGKSWSEADGDTAEAIDFLEFYAREMIRLDRGPELTPYPGEQNEQVYLPLGVGAIIPPWNFPLAILTGMTMSAVVAGNTVVVKPAAPTPVIAQKLVEILEQAGLPPGVVNLVPGPGPEIGEYLVAHPQIRFISFTGSKAVGLRINEVAAKVQPGQRWLKRVVAELGGKDAIIVDETADLEAAATGIVTSAFGFQGQKCSACSRAILVESIYDELLAKIIAKTKALTLGPVEEQSTQVGPVIDQRAYDKIIGYIEIGRTEGRLVTGGGRGEGPGYFIQPTIFVEVAPEARIAQEEIFGPVLAVIKAKDFDEALAIANDTEYGLTGAVYSNNRAHLEQARQEFHVGNLYFNRKCTGALVGVHPFGGFNLSGTDSKAGGFDYLLHFLQAKVISEYL